MEGELNLVTESITSLNARRIAESLCPSERYQEGNPVRRDEWAGKICPNSHNHVSAFPGYGRSICPDCMRVYVRGK